MSEEFKSTEGIPALRQSANGNEGQIARRARVSKEPKIPSREVWLDCDVAEYMKVCVRTVKRIVNEGAREGEIDLARARPVVIGGMRRWYADNVKKLVENGGCVR